MSNIQQDPLRLRHPGFLDWLYYAIVAKRYPINRPIRKRTVGKGGTSFVYMVKNPPGMVMKVVDTRILIPSIRDNICRHTANEIKLNTELLQEGICAGCTKQEPSQCRKCEKMKPENIIRLFAERYHIMPLVNGYICLRCPDRLQKTCRECPMRSGGTFPELMRSSDDYSDECRLFFLLMPKRETVYDRYLGNAQPRRNQNAEAATACTERDVLKLGMDICQALQICYDKNQFHRDLKPRNIFVQESNGALNFMLGDFGVARPFTRGKHTGFGTSGYSAPEARTGGCAKNSDIYSLGVTLFEVAGGNIHGAVDEQCEIGDWNGHLQWNEFKRRQSVSPELLAIIRKALMDQKNRYQTPMEMYQELAALYNRTRYHRAAPPRSAENHSESTRQASQPQEEVRHTASSVSQLQNSACDQLAMGNYGQAIALAKQGCDAGSGACEVILAYCRMIQVRRGLLDEGYRAPAERMLRQAADRNDPAALCLCATLDWEQGSHKDFLDQILRSAQLGFPAAQYIYGRGCCEGSAPFARNVVQGWDYLCRAAKAGYGDAIDFCAEFLNTHPIMEDAQSIRALARHRTPTDPARRRKDMANLLRQLK